MAKLSRTWWGQRFIEALETCMDEGRLGRGRAYAGPSRLLDFKIKGNDITARIRGNINPYFGVYKEPRYNVHIKLKPISAKNWTGVIKRLSANAAWISKLLMNEMPDNIEAAFEGKGLNLLPYSEKDLETDCSCPDWANPCKHIAGTYYHVASLLDEDPFLLFQLRGLGKEALHRELAKSPLGQALLSQLTHAENVALQTDAFRYTEPRKDAVKKAVSLKTFWAGSGALPPLDDTVSSTGVAAILIKKQGDFPPFWPRDNSFIEAMEAIYQQVRLKNADSL